MRKEIDEQNAVLIMLERDQKTALELASSMKAFISAIFGNDGWIRLVEARSLRKRQELGDYEYDPKDLDAVKVYVKNPMRPVVPR